MTTALISVLTWIISFLVYRHNKNKDKSSLVLDFNKEISKTNSSKLVIEYLFSAIYGAKGTDYTDIKMLIKHPLPQKAILNYLSVQRYINALELWDEDGEIRVIVTDAWKKGWRRRAKKIGFLIVIPAMYLLTKILSDISYAYFITIYDSTSSSIIKNGGIIDFIMELIVNIASPVMFSIVGYLAFRTLCSSMMIDSTAKFLDPTYSSNNS
ncbi:MULTISPECIES: hypothetical protein [unclassified Pantoea]|uniref:hypothetical protein n=1 Tax=unclassified Pantoea TaxID=2630326 RepID=UPI000A846C49|nr:MULTISPECIES: hypothetical protein [unclassified Pantoea]KAA5971568.1 hypothetical protein F3I15_05265 [Pantoea sp. M_9]